MSGIGCAPLRRHLEGKPLTLGQTVKAMCAGCCCEFLDGRYDCEVTDCPIYPRMPYRGKLSPYRPYRGEDTPRERTPPIIDSTARARRKEGKR